MSDCTPKCEQLPDAQRLPPPTPPNLPWMSWQVGQRVVVRRREADGLYDALGTLLEVTADYVVIDTRRGPVRVSAQKMVTGKLVPAAPVLPNIPITPK